MLFGQTYCIGFQTDWAIDRQHLPEDDSLHWLPGLVHASLLRNPLPSKLLVIQCESFSSCWQIWKSNTGLSTTIFCAALVFPHQRVLLFWAIITQARQNKTNMGIPVNDKCMLLREGAESCAYLDNVVSVVVIWKVTSMREGEKKEVDVSMAKWHECEFHSVDLKAFVSRRVADLPGLRSGETSNLCVGNCAKVSRPISTDCDQSGTSVTYGKSAKTANNSIEYQLFNWGTPRLWS